MVCTIKENKRTQLWPLCMKFRTHLRDEITVYWLKKKKKKTIKRTYHHPVDSNTSSSSRQPHPLSRNRCASLSLSRNSKDTFTQPESESVSPEEESSASPHSSSFSDDWRVRYVSVNWLSKFKVPSSSSSRFRKQFSGKKSLTDPVDNWDMFFVFKPP